MTSKIIVNQIEADAGISSVTFNDIIYGNLEGNITVGTGATISGSTNTIIASTNGSEKVRITSSGNIGIGTDNPTRKLDVEIQTASLSNGSVLNSHPIAEFINTSAGASRGLEIGASADSVTAPVYLKVSGTGNRFAILDQNDHENFTILNSGDIGIGTDNPSRQLEIFNTTQAALALKTSDTGQSSVWFSDESDTNIAGLYFEHDNESMVARTGDQPRLLINQNGSLFNTKGTNTDGTGGTILGRYKYSQDNQGNGYAHLILGPDGRKLQDYIGTNCYCIITVCVTGTGTNNMFCQYYYHANSSSSSSTLIHMYGNSGSSSNRPYMNLQNTHDPAWLMSHASSYKQDIEVAIYGGRTNYTFNPQGGISSFTTNP